MVPFAENLFYHNFHKYEHYGPLQFLCVILFNDKSRFEVYREARHEQRIRCFSFVQSRGHSGTDREAFPMEMLHMEKVDRGSP